MNGGSGGCEVAEEALAADTGAECQRVGRGQLPWPRFQSGDKCGCVCVGPFWHVFGKVVSGRRLETQLLRKSRIRIYLLLTSV